MIYLCILCSEAQYACHLVPAAWLDPPVAFLTSLTVGLVVEEYGLSRSRSCVQSGPVTPIERSMSGKHCRLLLLSGLPRHSHLKNDAPARIGS